MGNMEGIERIRKRERGRRKKEERKRRRKAQ